MSTIVDKISGNHYMKPELRKSFNLLKSHASKVANFTLQWQDLEEHLLTLDKSIQSKIDQLQLQQSEENPLSPTPQSQPSSIETELNVQADAEETQLDSNGSQLDSHVDSKETQLIATLQSLKPQLNCLEAQVKTEESLPESSSCNGIPINDGKALLLYLSQNLKERKSVRGSLADALKVSVDSGKLVLEAVRWFYTSESNKEDLGFETSIIRKSCVILLEALMEVRPVIAPEVRNEAMKLAFAWKEKVGGQTTNSLEVWACLVLLGAFGLGGEFDSDEILKLLGCVAERKQSSELFRSLGFADKASEFIQKLVSENKRLDAIRFIYAFEQLEKFPPAPLLIAHLKLAKKDARISCSREQDRLKAQDETADKEIGALRGIIRCIDDYKLVVEPQYSPEALRKRIAQLKRQKRERKGTLTAPGPAAQVPQLSGNKRTAPDLKAQPSNQNRYKHHRTAPNSAARNASFRAPTTVHLMQPSHLRRVDLYDIRGAEYYIPSAGMPVQAATLPNTSYGSTSSFNSLRASHHQQGGSVTGQGAEYSGGYYDLAHSVPDTYSNLSARPYGLVGSSPVSHTQHLNSTARDYGLVGSSPVAHTQHLSSTARDYGLVGSSPVAHTQHLRSKSRDYGLAGQSSVHMNSGITSYGLEGSISLLTAQMSPLSRRYGTRTAANGRTGQLGSAVSPPPTRNTNVSPNVYEHPLRVRNYNERPVSSTSGYDRPLSSTGGYGTPPQRPPAIYHL